MVFAKKTLNIRGNPWTITICIVDEKGKIIKEGKTLTVPTIISAFLAQTA